MHIGEEGHMRVESIRIPGFRANPGSCRKLANSIDAEGLLHPVAVWNDGTLISGERRLRAHMLLQRDSIPAVFVSTIEEAAKRLLADNQDEQCAEPMRPSDMCRLWTWMRRLDEPAAIRRLDDARRRGVVLRRQTQKGERTPGRRGTSGEEYLITVLSEPFGISAATAARTDRIWRTGHTDAFTATDEQRALARKLVDDLDSGETTVWSAYQTLLGHTFTAPKITAPNTAPAKVALPAAKQLAAWNKALPLLDGTIAGLTSLGPPSGLKPEQVDDIRTRLRLSRRRLDQMLNRMKENDQT